MSLTASTCITFTGYEPIGNTLFLYSNNDNFTTSFGSVLTSNITGSSCPYIINGIPNGTTSIQLRDPESLCCTTIFLQNNNLCVNCNLSITNYVQETVSQLVAGFLVGDCDDNISDYIIKWYKTGSSEVVLTTGYGTEFIDIGWQLTHPLTGNSSPIVGPGVYYPVIDRVIINGITYTNIGETGTFPANLNCFKNQTINVDALRCDNGNNLGDYSHHYLFENVSVGNPPDSLSASFFLSGNTNYLAWRFKGFDVEDRIKMIFYGSYYNNTPIVVEDIEVGNNIDSGSFNSSNLLNLTIPKSADTYNFYAKVTCLTAFTISEGDYITIQITPNPTNYNTKWDFYFKCLETFDCTTCLDNFKNTPYKIDTTSIYTQPVNCNSVLISFTVSGCTYNELIPSDTYKYFSGGGLAGYNNIGSPNQFPLNFYFQNLSCFISESPAPFSYCQPEFVSCSISTDSTITYQKSVINNEGFIEIEFSSYSDLEHYYDSYQQIINLLGIFTDNTQIDYYRYFNLKLPKPENTLEQCGDTTLFETYQIHCTSVVTTGGTGPWFMTLTMPTIVSNINFTTCELNCQSNVNTVVLTVNQSSLSSYNNINLTTLTGSKYNEPFYCRNSVVIVTNSASSTTMNGLFYLTRYANETIPYSGNTNTLIPSLSATTCDFINNSVTRATLNNPNVIEHVQFVYMYSVQLFDENDLTNFRIYGSPINNFQYSGSTPENNYNIIYELALEYSGDTITYQNPNYCI